MVRTGMCTCIGVAVSLLCSAAEHLGPPSPGQVGKHPKAVCPEPRYDWGTVFSGEEVIHTYTIANEGEAELLLTRVQESCGCTKKDYTRSIAPGDAGYVTLAIDTQKFTGKTQKRAVVHTNDPAKPKIILTFGGTASPLAKLSPLFPAMRGLLGGKPAHMTVTITPASDIPIESLKLTSKSSRLKVRVQEKKENEKKKTGTYTVHLETLPGITEDNFKEEVTLAAVAQKKKATISFPVHVRLRHRIELGTRNPYVMFHFATTAAWETDPENVPAPFKKVKVQAVSGVSFTITKLAPHGGFFEARVTEIKPKQEYELTVKLTGRPKDQAQPARGKLKIHTSDPIDKLLELSVIAFFK